MNKFEKSAVYIGLAAVSIAGGAVWLTGKLLREKKKLSWKHGSLEVVMSAGEIDTEAGMEEEQSACREKNGADQRETEEKAAVAGDRPEAAEQMFTVQGREAEEERKAAELQVVKVTACGLLTKRLRPTEEEEKEMLRRKLDRVIRF